MGSAWVGGKRGGADAAGLPYLACGRRACWGEGGRGKIRPCTRCSLLTFSFTLCLSFSYLHSAAEASFDTKKAYGKPYTSYIQIFIVLRRNRHIYTQYMLYTYCSCTVYNCKMAFLAGGIYSM